MQPTGENGATRAPIVVDLQREPGLSSKSIVLQIDSKSQQVSASKLDLVAVLHASISEFWKLGTEPDLDLEISWFVLLCCRCPPAFTAGQTQQGDVWWIREGPC